MSRNGRRLSCEMGLLVLAQCVGAMVAEIQPYCRVSHFPAFSPSLSSLTRLCGEFAIHRISCFTHGHGSGRCSARVRQATSMTLSDLPLDPFVVNMAIGGIAGTLSNCVVFPADLAKTKMQQAQTDSERRIYPTTFAAIAHIARTDGVGGLWQGFGPVMLGSAPESALQLAVHTVLVTTALSATGDGAESDLNLGVQVVTGGLSGASTLMATNPMEMLRIKASVSQGSILTNIKSLGFPGLFSGWEATLLRDIPFSAIYFPLYCQLKHWLGPLMSSMHAEGFVCSLAGLVAGMTSAFLTVPMDVVKTRLQTHASQRFQQQTDAGSVEPISIVSAVRGIVAGEGVSGFFAGASPRVGRLAPGMAMTLVVYENLQALIARL